MCRSWLSQLQDSRVAFGAISEVAREHPDKRSDITAMSKLNFHPLSNKPSLRPISASL